MRCSPRPSSPSWPNSRNGSRASRQGASGTVAVSVVPPPSGLSTSSCRPARARRSARPSRPEPALRHGAAAAVVADGGDGLGRVLGDRDVDAPRARRTSARSSAPRRRGSRSSARPARAAGARAARRARSGSGERAASASSATRRPRSLRPAGCRPRASSRSSPGRARACSAAPSRSSAAALGQVAGLAPREPERWPSATSRCWAPSWRSRPMRRRSSSAACMTRDARGDDLELALAQRELVAAALELGRRAGGEDAQVRDLARRRAQRGGRLTPTCPRRRPSEPRSATAR